MSTKGIVHPKMKTESLFTHPHANRRSSEVFHETLSQEKGVTIISQITAVNSGQVSHIKRYLLMS